MKAMKLCRLFAQQIVAGRMFFSEIAQRFKAGVKRDGTRGSCDRQQRAGKG